MAKRRKGFFRAACIGFCAVLLFSVTLWGFAPHAQAATDVLTGSIPPEGGVIEVGANTSLPTPPSAVSAHGAVLMEASSGTVIYQKNQDLRLPMASTTKIMTALVAIEHLPLDTLITVTEQSVGVEGSSIYLVAGEVLTLEDLLYALMLESANDAAETIAIAVAGSLSAFADLMNQKAASLGLSNTHFVNPHGLDAEDHYTTAAELATLTVSALENPDFQRICATKRHVIPLSGTDGARVLVNHNKLLSGYDGCIGVKTGYTKKTGRCLVSAAEREGVRLVAVTLGAPDDWRDHTAMLDYGFSLYENQILCEPDFYHAPMPIFSGDCDFVMVENTDPLAVILPRDHGNILCIVERRRFDFAPVTVGQIVGRLCFYEVSVSGERRFLGEVPLRAAHDINATTYKRTVWSRIRDFFD